MVETLVTGREAMQRHAWEEAVQALNEADGENGLAPEDLELLAQAAWWSGRPEEALEAFERAYTGYLEAGEQSAAALVAIRLSERAFRQLSPSIAQGWLARAERLLEDQPESAVHAWLNLIYTAVALILHNDPEAAIVTADRAIQLGGRHGDQDVQSLAMSFKGSALLKEGRVAEGLALIDEASAAATSGELEPKIACDVYCNTIAACRNLADYRRAGEWTDEAERWMQRQSIRGYVGICRVHRAELKRLRGSWSEAEQEARQACEELEQYRLLDGVGYAHNEVGEVRLHRGDLAAAEESFLRAYEYGWDPQPGLALLHLARGEVEEAARSIARTLDGGDGEAEGGDQDPLTRARLIPAQVEIALAGGDLETARAGAQELEDIARDYESPAWEAAALTARGAVELHEGGAERAVGALNRAWRLWQEIELPYESARARELLGRARSASGDESGARLELRAARSAFRRLGAGRDVERLEGLLDEDGSPDGDRRRVVKTFMFTDLVTSTDLVRLIGDEAWAELLAWHDRELRSGFARHGGEEVSHTGDGFFVAFDEAANAVECAVAVQRRLAEHRREHGFAPWVRIGLHTAEAGRAGGDYRGQGVHAAARVGELADREEIVVSGAVLEAAGVIRFPVSAGRSVTLKGLGDPVEVHTVDWR